MKQRAFVETPVFKISSFLFRSSPKFHTTASFLNIFISFPVITKITLKPVLNIQQILNLIKYKNIYRAAKICL
jgi:hypothetical protein